MAIPFSDNLQYLGTGPDFTRQEYATFADMKAVKKSRMPEKYIGYCLEDRKWYEYDKNNDTDEILGKWRLWSGGSDTQVTQMPTPVESLKDKIVQYIGETDENYQKGWFYICEPSGTEIVAVTTLARLTELINASQDTVTIVLADESEVSAKTYKYNDVDYFINESSIYYGTEVDGKITLASATVLATDEDVVAQNITEEVVTGWQWTNQSVSPSGGEPASIPAADIDELFN